MGMSLTSKYLKVNHLKWSSLVLAIIRAKQLRLFPDMMEMIIDMVKGIVLTTLSGTRLFFTKVFV